MTDVATLRRLLRQATGLDLPPEAVERAARDRLRASPGADPGAYAPRPGTAEFDALVELVVVPESWMLRIPAAFDEALAFVRRRLQERPGRPVHILSLPCAAGEEPYSMALTLEGGGIAPAQCRIDAFDLSHAAIARARAGRYTRNAFRGTDPGFAARHFTREGETFLIGRAPRDYVDFRQANLFALDTAALAGRYDLIFCRNLMIYFDQPTQAEAAARLRALLADDGLLLSGYAEVPSFCRLGFALRSPRDTFALQKSPASRAPLPTPAPPPVRMPVRAPAPPAHGPAPQPLPALPHAPPGPASYPAQLLLAEARRHADAGRLDQAGRLCRETLAQVPECADAWYLLGLVCDCAGQAEAAARHWRSCVYLEPDHYDALCGLALLYERRGDAGLGANYRRRATRAFDRLRESQA